VKKRFVVALDSHTSAQDVKFKEYVSKAGYGWWYWIDGFWLLVDISGMLSAEQLRKDLSEIYPGVRLMVLEINGSTDTWAGFGPSGVDKNMFTWLKENWN
jgi:hypothetical protein